MTQPSDRFQRRSKDNSAGRLNKAAAVSIVVALVSSWGVTEATAWLLNFQSALGRPLGNLDGLPVYYPWSWILWYHRFGGSGLEWIWLQMKGLAAFALLVSLMAGVMAFRGRRAAPASTIHGSARFAETRKEIVESGLLPRGKAALGCYVGGWVDPRTKEQLYLLHDGPEHILAFAPTRSGKGVGLVLPTLLSWRQSSVVHDIKGEAWALTAGWRQAIGQKVIRFSPAEDGSAGYNPLQEIRIGTDRDVADAQNVAQIIVDPEGKGMDDHWAKTGHELLSGALLHVLYSPMVTNKTLRGVISFFCDPSREMDDVIKEMLDAVHDPEGKFGWIDPITGKPTRTHPMIAEAARSMLNKAPNEKSGVQSTAMSYLTLYRDPIVARNTAWSDFRVNDLMNHDVPVTLYIVVSPSDKARLKPLIRLLISQIVRQLTEKMEFEGGRSKRTYKHRLLMMMDEFPALGKLEIIEDTLAFSAGYGIKFFLITQDVAQLWKAYTRDESIISNCHIRIAYAPNKIETAELLSKYCGQTTISQVKKSRSGRLISWFLPQVSEQVQDTGRPLLTPDEVLRLPGPIKSADGEKILEPGDMLVLPAGFDPIYGKQILYFRDPTFDGRSKVEAPASTDRLYGRPPGDPKRLVEIEAM